MENIPLPNNYQLLETSDERHAVIAVEPCFPGYGVTIGNALRRVLLSSLKGAGVVAVKIKDVQHEFMTLPNIKEDILEIIMNLKSLRLKMFTDDEVKLELKASGEKPVRAKDIAKNSSVEIVNPDLHIATLTDQKAELEMEIVVSSGRGYVPIEGREKEAREINTILVDSIFSPVQKVGLKIESVRVGQMTNYEKIILDIETDGTITPDEAVKQSSRILIDYFNFLLSGKTLLSEEMEILDEKEVEEAVSDSVRGEEGPALAVNEGGVAEAEEPEDPKKQNEDSSGEQGKEKKKRGRPKKEK